MQQSKIKAKHTINKVEILNYNGDGIFDKLRIKKKDKRMFNKRLRREMKKKIEY